jgi:CHRD domain
MKLRGLLVGIAVFVAQAASGGIITYDGVMSGPAENPPNASPGIGFAEVIIDTTANTMEVIVSFSGLLGTTTASHIHCCTAVPGTGSAGVATTTPSFPLFPLGVTSGFMDETFDLTQDISYNPSFEAANGGTAAGAEAALLAGMAADQTYLNIHTSVVPGGEIRTFLVATPEPTTFILAAGALMGLVGLNCLKRA